VDLPAIHFSAKHLAGRLHLKGRYPTTMLSQFVRPSAARSVASSYLARCQSSTAVAAARRSLSSNNNNNNSGVLRSSPAYNVFGEKNMLSVKVILPEWKLLKNGTLVLDQGKKGRILLEWSPRAPGGMLSDASFLVALWSLYNIRSSKKALTYVVLLFSPTSFSSFDTTICRWSPTRQAGPLRSVA
jgi:hypothetical protein